MNSKVLVITLILVLCVSAGCINPTEDSFLDNKTKLSAMNGAHGNGLSLTVGYAYNSSLEIEGHNSSNQSGAVDNNSTLVRYQNQAFQINESGTYRLSGENTTKTNESVPRFVPSPSVIDLTAYEKGSVKTEETERFGVASVGVVEGRTELENESISLVVKQADSINASDSYSVGNLETTHILPSEALGIRKVTVAGEISQDNTSYNFTHTMEYEYFTSYRSLESTREKLLR